MPGKRLNEEAFAAEYVKSGNATLAYKAAGGIGVNEVAHAAASRMLAKVTIQAAIARLQAVVVKDCRVSATRLLQEAGRVALSDGRKLFSPQGTLKPPDQWDDDTAAAVASVEVFEEYEGRGENRTLIGHTKKVKLWPKVDAIDKAARMIGAYLQSEAADAAAPPTQIIVIFPKPSGEAMQGPRLIEAQPPEPEPTIHLLGAADAAP